MFGSCFRTLAKSQAKVSFTVQVTRLLKGTPKEGASCPENAKNAINDSSYLALYHFNSYELTALCVINNDNKDKIIKVTLKRTNTMSQRKLEILGHSGIALPRLPYPDCPRGIRGPDFPQKKIGWLISSWGNVGGFPLGKVGSFDFPEVVGSTEFPQMTVFD